MAGKQTHRYMLDHAPAGIEGLSMKTTETQFATSFDGEAAQSKSISSGFTVTAKRSLALALIYLMVPLGVSDLYAQQSAPPPPDDTQQAPPAPDQDVVDNGGAPPQQYNALSPDQLDQLVAPIALYPDSLVAQLLAAATFPAQVSDADRFVQSNQGYAPAQISQMADGMQWDPSVKALTAFPSVLSNMDRNMDWTTRLGNAYYNQPQDVMAAVQAMRQQAYQSGNLRTNQQETVAYDPGNIVIEPVNPAVVYVPYYNPWVVYGAPIGPWYHYYVAPPPPGIVFGVGLAIGFGLGIAIGAWSHWGWGWGHWGCGWGSRTVVYNRTTYISRSVTVINHGYYGRFDRNVAARAYNRNIAMHAVAYNRPGFAESHAGVVNRPGMNNFNRPTAGNSFNRAPATNNFNNFNRGSVNNSFNRAPAATNNNFNRAPYNNGGVNNSFNRVAPNNNFNRPAPSSNTFNRAPAMNNNFSRPQMNNNSNFNRAPQMNNNFNRAPQGNVSRPQTNFSRPAPSNSGGGHFNSGGGGHPSGGGSRPSGGGGGHRH